MLDKAFRLIIAEAYVVYIYPAFYGVKRALRVGAFLRLVYKLKYPCGAGKRVLHLRNDGAYLIKRLHILVCI